MNQVERISHCVTCTSAGYASQVYGYCMFMDGRQAKVAYPMQGMAEDIAGRSFHNGRFVQRLRQAAASQPSITVRQGTALCLLNGMPHCCSVTGWYS